MHTAFLILHILSFKGALTLLNVCQEDVPLFIHSTSNTKAFISIVAVPYCVFLYQIHQERNANECANLSNNANATLSADAHRVRCPLGANTIAFTNAAYGKDIRMITCWQISCFVLSSNILTVTKR